MAHNEVQPEEVPEVVDYLNAKEMLEAFKANNPNVFVAYERMVEDLNQKMEAADKAIRQREVSCADWELYQYQTKVDAEALFNAVGLDAFLRIGGSTTTKTVYAADKAKVQAAIARGDIPAAIAEDIITESARYHAPKKAQ